jgi:phenylpropionate dioxygenase-like ring-hydroxylating dioxygenase large terminal subunit
VDPLTTPATAPRAPPPKTSWEEIVNDIRRSTIGADETPVIIPIDSYVSPEYARAESEKLWPNVWQAACRVDEIPKVGDYVTYDILDESIIVVRTATERIQAFYNVCQHRGRRLTSGCGHTAQFYCRFHGWRWALDGENVFVLDREDWGEALTPENLRLKEVTCDTWGGWVWINMDPKCEPLLDYLNPVSTLLAPFELERLRYRWRQWLYLPCNWKTVLGAFMEAYHIPALHPQAVRGGLGYRSWSRAEGRHAWSGAEGVRGHADDKFAGFTGASGGAGEDPRVATAEQLTMMWEMVNATTTETFVNAARRLVDELPPGASADEVARHLMAAARRDDAARGVSWPDIDPAYLAATCALWHVFPNTIIVPSITTTLCYRARPNGYDPDSCIFEVSVIERFPEGQAPKTEWVFEPDPSEEKWRLLLAQDFKNMPDVQRGMKSRGFQGARPSPVQELTVTHFNRILAHYMGSGAPRPAQ